MSDTSLKQPLLNRQAFEPQSAAQQQTLAQLQELAQPSSPAEVTPAAAGVVDNQTGAEPVTSSVPAAQTPTARMTSAPSTSLTLSPASPVTADRTSQLATLATAARTEQPEALKTLEANVGTPKESV